MERTLHNNIHKIYLLTFFQSAMIITAIIVPLMQGHGLSMSQVLQTQAVFAAIIAAFEVPSGYIADIWGRKNAIVCGSLICLLAFIWLASVDSFNGFIIYEVLMGIGISLHSGADLALIYDTQNALNRCDKRTHRDSGTHISRLTSLEGLAGASGGIFAGLLSAISLDAVLQAQIIVSLLALLSGISLTEAPRILSQGNHADNLRQVKTALLVSPLILWTIAAITVFSVSALFAFWLSQKYWALQQIPLSWFGYIWAGYCVVRAISAHYAQSLENYLGSHRLFLLVASLPIIGFAGMGFVDSWIGVLCGFAFPIGRGLSLVVFYQALNKRLDETFRATINSLTSLAIRSVFILTAPLLGIIVDTQGIRISLVLLALIFLPIFALVLFPLSVKIYQTRTN